MAYKTLMLKFGVPPWELVLRSALIYLALLAALRVFGKREVGQFTLYDLVLVLLVANAVQPAMTGPDTSLGGGLVIILTLVLLNFLVGQLDRLGLFHRLLEPEPTVVVRNGQYLAGNMRREGVEREEVESAIREHGIDDVSDVQMAVLEPDGAISIVGKDAEVGRTKRRVRSRHQR
jgi:uncharacterized membrane protein YcaP (DUF421 family)